MKKIFSVLLALCILCFTLVGCGKEKTVEEMFSSCNDYKYLNMSFKIPDCWDDVSQSNSGFSCNIPGGKELEIRIQENSTTVDLDEYISTHLNSMYSDQEILHSVDIDGTEGCVYSSISEEYKTYYYSIIFKNEKYGIMEVGIRSKNKDSNCITMLDKIASTIKIDLTTSDNNTSSSSESPEQTKDIIDTDFLFDSCKEFKIHNIVFQIPSTWSSQPFVYNEGDLLVFDTLGTIPSLEEDVTLLSATYHDDISLNQFLYQSKTNTNNSNYQEIKDFEIDEHKAVIHKFDSTASDSKETVYELLIEIDDSSMFYMNLSYANEKKNLDLSGLLEELANRITIE